MKKIIAILLILVFSLAACKGGKTPADKKGNMQGGTESSNTTDTLVTDKEADFSYIKNDSERLAMQWVYDRYKEYNVSNIIIRTNYDVTKGISNYHAPDVIIKDGDAIIKEWDITFKAENNIAGLIRQSDNTYKVVITQILVSKAGNVEVVDCYIKNADVSEYNLEMLYNSIKKDGRFASDLLEFPKNELPKEIKAINIREVCGIDYSYDEVPLNEQIIALVGRGKTDRTYVAQDNSTRYYYKYVVYLYNHVTGEKNVVTEINDCVLQTASVKEHNLKLTFKMNNKEVYKHLTINPQGEIVDSREEVISYEVNYESSKTYSPSGKYCAFINDVGMYCQNVETGEEKLLIKHFRSEENEGLSNRGYHPYKFLDENRLIYTCSGYEWSNGFGIYNVETGTDKFIEGTMAGYPIGVLGENIFFVVNDDYDPYGVKVVQINNNYKIRTVMDSTDKAIRGYFAYRVSEDCTLLAVLTYLGNKTYEISSYDLATYKKIKTYTMSSGLMSVQYIDFLDNGKILLTGERHALCDKYMFVLDITR